MKEFNYTINGTPYRVVVNKSDSEMVELEVNGTPYSVELVQKKKKSLAGVKRPSTVSSPTHRVPPHHWSPDLTECQVRVLYSHRYRVSSSTSAAR